MLRHIECPSCGWEGSVLANDSQALCPECEWYFGLPAQPWDAVWELPEDA